MVSPKLLLILALLLSDAAHASRKVARDSSSPRTAVSRPDAMTTLPPAIPPGAQAQPQAPVRPAGPPPVAPRRFGRFDLDMPFAQLRALPDLRDCADALKSPAGQADCSLPHGPDNLARAQLAWEETRNGSELIALRLQFDPQTAPALTEIEWQLTRGWGPPSLEQLRRDRDQKFFTLQWEDGEHRATIEAQGPLAQPSRATAVVLERKQLPLAGEFVALHPRPFPGMRVRWIRKVDWDGQLHALLWGTSLTPVQEAMGDKSAAWPSQRNYVGLWKLEPATATRPRRWRPLWERIAGHAAATDSQHPPRAVHRRHHRCQGQAARLFVARCCKHY